MTPQKFDEPIRCISKQGQRVWVQLTFPHFASTVWNIREEVQAADEDAVEELEALAQKVEVSKCRYRRKEFWRVVHKDEDIAEKFPFDPSDNGTIKTALLEALSFQHRYGEKHDFVSCLLVPELKEHLDSAGLPRKGSAEILRSNLLKHLMTKKDTPSKTSQAKLCDGLQIAKAAKPQQEKGKAEDFAKEKPAEKQGKDEGHPKGTMWVATSGKFDRCSLGHSSQMDRENKLEESIRAGIMRAVIEGDHVQATNVGKDSLAEDLAAQCKNVLTQNPFASESDEVQNVQALFLQVGRFNSVVAGLMKHCGYSSISKFQKCDTWKLCRMVFMHFTSFCDEASGILKKGLRSAVESGSMDKWKEVLEEEMRDLELVDTYMVTSLLGHEDVLDALGELKEWKDGLKSVENDIAKKPQTLSVTRGRPVNQETQTKLNLVQKKLKKMKAVDGNLVAEQAFEMLKKLPSRSESLGSSLEGPGVEPQEGPDKSAKTAKKKKKTQKSSLKIKDRYLRQKGDELRLKKKIEIVEWGLKNESTVQGSIDAALKRQFEDYRSRRYAHWRKLYFVQKWKDVPPEVAAKCSTLPNKYRAKVHQPLKGPGNGHYGLPPEVEAELQRLLEELTEGKNATMRRSDKVCYKDIDSTLEYLKTEVNRQAQSLQQEIQSKNQKLLLDFCSGKINEQDLCAKWSNEPRLVKNKDFHHMRKNFVKKLGWSKQACNTSGSYLPYDDAKMARLLSCNECTTALYLQLTFIARFLFDTCAIY
eukprot:Skav230505  [mRNA]  locus=scaffold2083:167902:171745:- [translate_table: standard]